MFLSNNSNLITKAKIFEVQKYIWVEKSFSPNFYFFHVKNSIYENHEAQKIVAAICPKRFCGKKKIIRVITGGGGLDDPPENSWVKIVLGCCNLLEKIFW